MHYFVYNYTVQCIDNTPLPPAIHPFIPPEAPEEVRCKYGL